MLKVMQKKAFQLYLEAERADNSNLIVRDSKNGDGENGGGRFSEIGRDLNLKEEMGNINVFGSRGMRIEETGERIEAC